MEGPLHASWESCPRPIPCPGVRAEPVTCFILLVKQVTGAGLGRPRSFCLGPLGRPESPSEQCSCPVGEAAQRQRCPKMTPKEKEREERAAQGPAGLVPASKANELPRGAHPRPQAITGHYQRTAAVPQASWGAAPCTVETTLTAITSEAKSLRSPWPRSLSKGALTDRRFAEMSIFTTSQQAPHSFRVRSPPKVLKLKKPHETAGAGARGSGALAGEAAQC